MDKFSTQEGSPNCKNISKCGKKWKLKYGIVASTFKLTDQNTPGMRFILYPPFSLFIPIKRYCNLNVACILISQILWGVKPIRKIFMHLKNFAFSLWDFPKAGLAFWWRGINSSPQKLPLNSTREWFVAHLGSFHYHLIAVFHGNHSPDYLLKSDFIGSPGFL